MNPRWSCLLAMAESEVQGILRRLPARLREQARSLPVTYETVPNPAIVADGFGSDLLGLFVGKAFGEEESGYVEVPSQIILFLANLWDFAEGDQAVYREEVQTTYLHELGHYLGLDELDLEDRGLD